MVLKLLNVLLPHGENLHNCPQIAQNAVSDNLVFKMFSGGMPWIPLEKHASGARLRSISSLESPLLSKNLTTGLFCVL